MRCFFKTLQRVEITLAIQLAAQNAYFQGCLILVDVLASTSPHIENNISPQGESVYENHVTRITRGDIP